MHTCMIVCYLDRIQLRCPIDSWPHLSRACPCPSPLAGCPSFSKEESILVKKNKNKKNKKHKKIMTIPIDKLTIVDWSTGLKKVDHS